MKVSIKGMEYEYVSDFDPVNIHDNVIRNWKVSAGDYFKFPVKIGNHLCFVKRFNKKNTEISGYDFLVRIKGKELRGLPAVYDVVGVSENGHRIIYLFTEFIPGHTVDSLHRDGFEFLPAKMGEDIYHGLKAIHENGYWFPDFDPKNFIRCNKGNFYVIDLDSTYPVSALPASSMFGSKDFWAPVYEYYKRRLAFSKEEIKKIRGDVLNNLSLIYLMGLYSFYLDDKGEDLTAHSIVHLNDYLEKKHKLFSSTMVYCCNKNGSSTIHQRSLTEQVLQNLLKVGLFPDNVIRKISNAPHLPEITAFKINGKPVTEIEVNAGQPVQIEWSVRNATSIKLLPDNKPLVPSGLLIITPTEDTIYTLEAGHKYKGKLQNVRKSVDITIYDPVLRRPKIEFSVAGFRNQAVIPENSTYNLQWTVDEADKVYLDNIEVGRTGSKIFSATRNLTHTLHAVNTRNGSSKKAEGKVDITMDKVPVMKFYTSSTEITSGEFITLNWQVVHGKNICLLQNGNTIAENCPAKGTMNLKVESVKNLPSPQTHNFTLTAISPSGQYLYKHEPAIQVKVKKPNYTATWIILTVFIALIIFVIVLVSKSQGSQETTYESPVYDTTSTVSADSTVSYPVPAPTADTTVMITAIDSTAYPDTAKASRPMIDITDNFDNGNYYDWPVTYNSQNEISIRYGYLQVRGITTGFHEASKNFDIDLSGNFYMGVSCKPETENADNYYGIIFCSSSAEQYFFKVSSNGYYKIDKYSYSAAHWETLRSPTYSPEVRTGLEENRLFVEKSGDYISFYINGNLVDKLFFTMKAGTEFGFATSGQQTVTYRSFRIKQLANE